MKKTVLLTLALITYSLAFSQSDSLILKNGNVIVGDLKDMDKGVATIETDYSDQDFKIEWDGISKIYTSNSYLITTSDGKRFNASIETVSPGVVRLSLDKGGTTEVNFMDIVFLKSIDVGFWNKVNAFVDIGFDLARANRTMTFSTRMGFEYLARRWSAGLKFNTNFITQKEGPDNQRTEGSLNYKYFLPKDFYIMASENFLRSSELSLNSRWTTLAGAGYYFIHNNRMYWGADAGVTYNAENYAQADSVPNFLLRKTFEGFLGTNLNMFDIGDLNLSTGVKAFPSFTEAGRWRVNFNIDTKYDLPLDFYIKLGFSLNYDNRPVEGGSDLDYNLTTGFGWEW